MADRTQLITALQQYYQEGKLTDIKLDVRGTKLSAHRLVLSLNSYFFEGLFCGPFKEAKATEIKIDENPQQFKRFIDYLYGSKFTDTEMLDLFVLNDRYQLKGFDKEEAMKLPITKENFNKYISALAFLFPEGDIPSTILTSIIVATYRGLYNLSELDDDNIISLFSIPCINPSNLITFKEEIDELVASGRSQELYSLINMDLYKLMTNDCSLNINGIGLIPNLTKFDPDSSEVFTLMVISCPNDKDDREFSMTDGINVFDLSIGEKDLKPGDILYVRKDIYSFFLSDEYELVK